ncbi:hypothetical protein MMC30_006298 [Trapelia coarctata]|nr:hypothetical protein [Trapelia coarctata]
MGPVSSTKYSADSTTIPTGAVTDTATSSSSPTTIFVTSATSTSVTDHSSKSFAAPTEGLPSASNPVSNPVSTVAKVGIGVLLGTILLLLLAAFVKKRPKWWASKSLDLVRIGRRVKRGAAAKELDRTHPKREVEVDTQFRTDLVELPSDGPTHIGRYPSWKELDGTHWKRELEGDTHFRVQLTRQDSDESMAIKPCMSREELDGTHWKRELEGDIPGESRV